jgi:hypothetical protein
MASEEEIDALLPKQKPPKRKPGKKSRPRRFLKVMQVPGVNMGNGERTAWVYLSKDGITVRQKHSRHSWHLPWEDAAGTIARRAQAKAVAVRLSR